MKCPSHSDYLRFAALLTPFPFPFSYCGSSSSPSVRSRIWIESKPVSPADAPRSSGFRLSVAVYVVLLFRSSCPSWKRSQGSVRNRILGSDRRLEMVTRTETSFERAASAGLGWLWTEYFRAYGYSR